jgi:hypothetical protein
MFMSGKAGASPQLNRGQGGKDPQCWQLELDLGSDAQRRMMSARSCLSDVVTNHCICSRIVVILERHSAQMWISPPSILPSLVRHDRPRGFELLCRYQIEGDLQRHTGI